MIPIFGIAGNAGSGKSALSDYLASQYNGVCVAQADPMKQIARLIFDFSEEQLWGPSEKRNELDTGYTYASTKWDEVYFSLRPQKPATTHICEIFGSKSEHALALFRDGLVSSCEEFSRVKGGLTPRHVLQQMGTEVGRRVDVNVWARTARETCMKLLCGGYRYDRKVGLVQDGSFGGYSVAFITDMRFRNEILGLRAEGGVVIRVVRPDPTAAAKTSAAGVAGHQSEAELGGVPPHFYSVSVQNDDTLETLYQRGNSAMEIFGVRTP